MDILLLQEHWLFGYEKDEINGNLPQWNAVARSVDDQEPMTPAARTLGHGGVANMWKDELTANIQHTDEGNERILPSLLRVGNKHLCIINCYLPSGNAAETLCRFIEDIAVMQAIIEKYMNTHSIIVAGDLNADILHRNTRKEKTLLNMVDRLNLKIANTPLKDMHTFCHKSMDRVTSHLDYFITSQDLEVKICIMEDATGNTSAHYPVCAIFNIKHDNPKESRSSDTEIRSKKVKWHEGDPIKYQEELAKCLDADTLQTLDLEEAVMQINKALKKAESSSFPSTERKPQRRSQKSFPPEVLEAIAASKQAHYAWKQNGRPEKDHPLTIERRRTSGMVRRIQRIHEAKKRTKLYNDILNAHEKDQVTFFKLLRRNHGEAAKQLALRINGEITYDTAIQRESWANFYEDLAAPKGDVPHKTLIDTIRQLSKTAPGMSITLTEVETAIKKLNLGKATDFDGIQAEHFKYGGRELFEAVAVVMNKMLHEGRIPDSLKVGFKTPVPKKGKDLLEQGNYRGITITPTLGKIAEHILQDLAQPELGGSISNLQFGFTKDSSPAMATLCLTEAAAEAKDTGHHLYVATLDAQKAFDVVSHNLLKMKLHHSGVQGINWTLIDNLYSGCTEMVRWKGCYSRPYQVGQGVRQGGVLSTTLYKEYINPLLADFERSNVGLSIGDVYLGSPTCADDILLLSESDVQLQVMLNDAHTYSLDNRYRLHPGKSTVTQLIGPRGNTPVQLQLGEEEIKTTTTFTHLGMDWNQGKLTPSIEEKISLGRRTAYLLIGSGLHGTNGISPVISSQVMTTQVLPRMTYGLEATTIKSKSYNLLNKSYKALLRQHQGLPERTASEAIYLLVGKYPAEVHINYKSLLLFGAISRKGLNTPLYDICRRQLSKPDDSNSWFVHLRELATLYDIDIMHPLIWKWTKLDWKRHIRESVFGRAYVTLIQGASQRSSLRWLDLRLCIQNTPHPIWKSSTYNLQETKKASIRAKILTGTYMFQKTTVKYGKSQDPTCKMCGEEEEDTIHFMLRCSALEEYRQEVIPAINLLLEEGNSHLQNQEKWVKVVLNGGEGGVLRTNDWCTDFNKLCNKLVFNLHKNRDIILNLKLLPH